MLKHQVNRFRTICTVCAARADEYGNAALVLQTALPAGWKGYLSALYPYTAKNTI
ncbi:hypothetical protein [Neisseria meningitidis]|uniref:hypothetical protein n=1 Tax=Neisseria meningitidis TaxID=487 RepID=UPI001F5D3BDB|nr:hypothetical protein [Neisseria meningitidis]